MNHREKIKNKNSYRELFSVGTLCFVFLLITTMGFSQTNNPKEEYDINDPRNPNCPCHEHQRIADEEYALLNNPKKKLPNASGMQIVSNKQIKLNPVEFDAIDLKIKPVPMNTIGLSVKKRKNNWFSKKVNSYKIKHRKQFKCRFKLDDCFRW